MQLLRHIRALKDWQYRSVVTVGAFDGLHLGHQALMQQLKQYAQQHQCRTVVVLFEPQPKEFFAGATSSQRILRLRDKLSLLSEMGVDAVVCLKFDKKFARIAREGFVETILVDGLQTEHLVIGDDFKFGKDRLGDFAYCVQAGAQFGFTVSSTPTVMIEHSRVSSSAVRCAIEVGDFERSKVLLGRDYVLSGKVTHGDKRGRLLGFPTANVILKRQMAVHGVYIVKVALKQKSSSVDVFEYYGVANVGRRPTIDDDKNLLEVFILDFDQQIYGQTMAVTFLHKLRDETKFDGIGALKAQIDHDVILAKRWLNSDT